MKYQELAELTVEELSKKLADLEESYWHQREEVLTGKESNSAVLKHLRADIARVKTAISAQKGA